MPSRRPPLFFSCLLCVAAAAWSPALGDDRILDPRAAERIEHLLADAEIALAGMRLTTPAHDNAYDRYRQVLAFLPDHPRALTGITRIADAYFGLALAAAERGDEATAERLFDLGRDVAPEHASTPTVANSIRRLLTRPEARIALDSGELSARSPALAERLRELGAQAKRDQLLVVITAPRDEMGRWIYQQMNAAPPHVRLRARSEIGQPAVVELRDEG
ncbi:MAG: hypothetical protein EA417_07275 [Gammaproteobacteria bacterium]|nr:MAG: hypothetical protein EA417_07275 [Gammaproteobacteria bacterium]